MPDETHDPAAEASTCSSGLDAHAICAHLEKLGGLAHWEVRVAPSVDSTNTVLMREARSASGAFSRPVMLAAEAQTAGRGRLGRSWRSASGASLAISFGWTFTRESLSGLSLVCGLAVQSVLSSRSLASRLKWPNDVLVNGRKIAGILVESLPTGDGARDVCTAGRAARSAQTIVVAGIGINLSPASHQALVHQSSSHNPSTIGAPADAPNAPDATDVLTEAGMLLDRNHLAAELAQALGTRFTQFESDGFGAFAAEWNAVHAWAGRRVELIESGRIVADGIALGVDALGQLLLDTAGGVRIVIAGDVSLRAHSQAVFA